MCLPIAFLCYVTWNAHSTEREARERKNELAAELAAVEARAQALGKDIETLKDPRGVEAELRKRYDVGWSGEESIVLLDDTTESAQATPTPPVQGKTSAWERFVDIVF